MLIASYQNEFQHFNDNVTAYDVVNYFAGKDPTIRFNDKENLPIELSSCESDEVDQLWATSDTSRINPDEKVVPKIRNKRYGLLRASNFKITLRVEDDKKYESEK
ncbi:hypothetical protein ABK040_009492 [Willaertia magna]